MSNVDRGYAICDLLLEAERGGRRILGAEGIRAELDWNSEEDVRRGLNTVRAGLCPPYEIVYVRTSQRGHYTVIDRETSDPVADTPTAREGERAWAIDASTRLKRRSTYLEARAERETNPAQRAYLYQRAGQLRAVITLMEMLVATA
jgi:hypothetical protein